MLPEIYHYLLRLETSRHNVAELIRNLPADALNWRPQLPNGADPVNSMGVLAVHLAGAEHHWISEVIDGAPASRDRAAEFAFVAESAEEPLALLEAVAVESEAVLSALSAEDLEGERLAVDMMIPVRFAILHVIDHYALHLGHMQLSYQVWNEGKAAKGTRWFDRLAKRPAD